MTSSATLSAAAGRRNGLGEYALTILRGLGWPIDDSAPRTLGLTSCVSGEGVSTLAVQLAIAAAGCCDHRVLLVDGNLHRPAVHRYFRGEVGPGLADVLLGRRKLMDSFQATPIPNLSLLAAGATAEGQLSRVYDSPQLPEMIGHLKQNYSLVVCDLPSNGRTSAAVRLASLLDGILLVIEAERVRWEAAQRLEEVLHRSGARPLGAVLNKRRHYLPRWLDRRR